MRRFLALAALTLLCGCGGGDGVVKYDITGTVTVDGTPLGGAAVILATNQGAVEAATTDDSGKFSMKAKAGSAQVGVSKTEVSGPVAEGSVNFDSPARPEEGGVVVKPKVKYLIAEKYNNPQKSGLSVTVPEGGGDVGEIKVSAKE